MKSTFLFLSLAGFLISFSSCKKSEEKITPTNEPQIIDLEDCMRVGQRVLTLAAKLLTPPAM